MTGMFDWLLLGYLLILGVFTFYKDRWHSTEPLRGAWVAVSWLLMAMAVFSLIRAGNYKDPRDLMLTEIWQNGFVWFFFGISIYRLSGLLDDSRGNEV